MSNSPERKSQRASDLARCLLNLARLDGVILIEEGRLILLSSPAGRATDPAGLARVLFADRLAGCRELGKRVGAGAVHFVGKEDLAGWARDVARLEGSPHLGALVKEGVRPLRRYRAVDLPARISSARQRLALLGELLPAVEPASPCLRADAEEDPALEALLQALPLRLHALGSWGNDPVALLQRREFPADAAFVRLARTSTDPALAVLAALLLGIRQRGRIDGGRSPVETQLPSRLLTAFQAGRTFCPAPCLWARALAEGLDEWPPFPVIPENDLAEDARACERLGLLSEPRIGLTALANLARAHQGAGEMRARLHRFESLVKAAALHQAVVPSSAEEAELLHGLGRLEKPGHGTAEDLVDLFQFWMRGSGTPGSLVGRRELRRLARKGLLPQPGAASGPVGAAHALAVAWERKARAKIPAIAPPSRRRQKACLTLQLRFATEPLLIPGDLTAKDLENLDEFLSRATPGRARQLWAEIEPLCEVFRRQRHVGFYEQMLAAFDWPAPLVTRALQLDLASEAFSFNQPQQLASYLDCAEQVRQQAIPGLDAADEWFARLFRTGKRWAPALVLTLLSKARGTGPGHEQLPALLALGHSLAGSDTLAPYARELVGGLELWSNPVLEQPPPELEPLAGLLGVERNLLMEYLHYRRLAGHGETFAAAVSEPLRQAQEEAREAAYLGQWLALDPEAAGHKGQRAERLLHLTDPEQTAGRLRQAAARSRKRLQRSLSCLKEESLESILDRTSRAYLERYLGKPVRPGPLPEGMRESLLLLSAQEIDHDLLTSFLTDVLLDRPMRDQPLNQAWLERARVAGIDTSAWLTGVSASIEIEGCLITFASERNPLRVLQMGSHFDTCLSLGGGCNAASTLVNALDINKQVIYGRRPDGTVVARKLIGANLRGELAGYRTYAMENVPAIRAMLSRVVGEFARRCRLRLSDRSTPEILHPGFWYDDGNEDWGETSEPLLPAEALPADVPPDPVARAEWYFRQAVTQRDPNLLRTVAAGGQAPWSTAALYRLLWLFPDTAVGLRSNLTDEDRESLSAFLTSQGAMDWAQRLPQLLHEYSDYQRLLHDYLPWDAPLPETLRKLAEAVRERGLKFDRNLHHPGAVLVNFPLVDLLTCLEGLVERELQGISRDIDSWYWEDFRDRLPRWVSFLQAAWLRDGDSAAVVRALTSSHPVLTPLLVRLACLEVIPGLAPGLRRLLRKDEPERHSEIARVLGEDANDETALALGSQGDPQDGPRLLDLLRRQPDSLPLAVAVVRCGHEEAAAEARNLWRPPQSLTAVLDDPRWLSLARELGSRRLARALGREVRRALPPFLADPHTHASWQLLRRPLYRLALLGLPEPEGDAAALLQGLVRQRVLDPKGAFVRETLPQLVAMAEVRQLPDRTARLAQGPPGSLRALAWWQQLQESSSQDKRSWLRDDGFERAVRRLAVKGTPKEQAAALEIWVQLEPNRVEFLILRALERRQDNVKLPDPTSRVLLGGIEGSSWGFWPSFLEAVFAWVEGLPEEEQRLLLRGASSHFHADTWTPTWIRHLEGSDPGRRQVAELFVRQFLADYRPGTGDLLRLLPNWLDPPIADSLVADLVPHLDDDGLLRCLSPERPWPSYHLQRHAIRELLTNRDESCRQRILEQLRQGEQNQRNRWVLEQLTAAMK